MIKEQDLRIGNLVYVGYSSSNEIVRGTIDKSANLMFYGNHYHGLLINYPEPLGNRIIELDNCEPIPLTEEMLLKVGFDKEISNCDEERVMYSIQVSNITSLYFDKHKDWLRNDIPVEWYLSHEWNNNHFKNDLGWNYPKYLHQLQNLYFSLTGQELNTAGLI